jgi:hypothetical protein
MVTVVEYLVVEAMAASAVFFGSFRYLVSFVRAPFLRNSCLTFSSCPVSPTYAAPQHTP